MGYSVKHGYLDTILKVASSPLVTQAIALRTKTYPEFPNPKCTFTIPAPPNGVGEHNPWAGRYNVHFPLDFDNGPRWLARVRGQDSAQPLGHEHAVLELLHGVVPQWTSRSWLVNSKLDRICVE
jgi:hypothetical protein